MLRLFSVLVLMSSLPQQDPVQELIRLEQQLTDALVRNDIRTIDSLWADDLVFIGLNGKPSSKSERLSGMKAPVSPSQPTVTAAVNDQVKVRLYGETAVVTLLSRWTTRANNRESIDQYMTTHVWARQQGKWRLVSAHVTRLAQ